MQESQQLQKTIRFFVLFLLAGASAGAIEVELKSTVACRHPFVTLGDIAAIRDCDATTKGQLEAVPLLPGPAEGRIRVLRVREIQELLALRGKDVDQLEWRGSSRVQLRGEAAEKVSTQSDSFTSTSTSKATGKLVVVATRPLQVGDTIHTADVELKTVSFLRGQKSPIDQVEDAIGMQVARSVTTGQVVDASNLRRPILVQRLGSVTVFSRIGGIQVSTKGRALEEGAEDDVITVELTGKKRVTVRVVGLDEVEVFAQGVALQPSKMRPAPVTPQNRREIARQIDLQSAHQNEQ